MQIHEMCSFISYSESVQDSEMVSWMHHFQTLWIKCIVFQTSKEIFLPIHHYFDISEHTAAFSFYAYHLT